MLRRFCTVALACALPVAVLPVTSASAVEPTAYTYDRIHDNANGPSLLQQAYAPATLTYEGVSATVTFAKAGITSIAVTPPAGQSLAAGTSFPVHSGAATAETGRLVLSTLCPSTGYAGTVTVHEVAFGDGSPSTFAADYEATCKDTSVVGSYAGSLRHGTDRSYVLARVTPATPPQTGVGMTKATTVTVVNAGTAAFTPGTPALSGAQASEWAVASDTCAGNQLAPGASCAIGLTLTPGALGARRARLDIPVPGHPRASGAGAALIGYGIAPPGVPGSAEVVPTANGPRVAWWAANMATSYTVFRRPASDAEWTALGDTTSMSYVDTTLARGETAEYAVAGVGTGGTGGKRTAGSITRAATDPVVGTGDTLLLESTNANLRAVHYSTTLGDALARQNNRLSINNATGSASVALPRVTAPGTYDLTPLGVTLTIDSFHCNVTGGSIDVGEVLYDPIFGDVATYAASFSAACNNTATTVTGLARFRSAMAYQGVRVPAAPADWRVATGTESERTLTFASGGSTPVTFGAATFGGNDPSYFSVVSNACEGQTLANAATCDVVVRVAMSGTATRTATVTLADDTARGSHSVALTAIPLSLPGAPTSVEAHVWRIGRNTVGWGPPQSDGNSPVTTYRLYRQVGDGTPELLLDAKTSMYTDTRAPGAAQRYGVAAVNSMGEGAIAWSPVVVTAAQEMVYVSPHSEYGFGLTTQVPGAISHWLSNEPFEDHDTPAVSPDGSLIAYARTNGEGYDLFVRNADGTGTPRNLTGATMGGAVYEYDAAFSNDGRYLAFTRETETTIEVWQVPVAGGTPVKRANTAASPSWLPDSRSLVVSDYSSESARMLRIAPNNTRSAIAGTEYGDEPAVSPDGRWIAFTRFDPTLETGGLAIVPVAGGTAKHLRDTTGGTEWFSPSWRGDGKALLATQYDGGIDVVTVAWNGTALAVDGYASTEEMALSPVWRSVGLALVSPPYLTRSTPSIGFQVSAPYTTATCALDSGAAAPCTSPWTRTGVASGAHTLTIRASAPGMTERVLTHTFTADSAAPAVSTSLPNTPAITGSAATFRYAATDASGVASYDARYRRAPYNGTFGAFTSPAGWTGTRATQLSLAVTPGSEYCFSVRARDTLGNVSGWTPERCTASPLDDRSLGGTGWSRLTGAGYYRSTYTSATTAGRSLTVGGVQAKRLVLVATRCSTCGTVAVYMGTTLVANVNLAAPTTQKAYQILLPAFTTVRSGTVTIRVTSSGKMVQVDGLGVRRT